MMADDWPTKMLLRDTVEDVRVVRKVREVMKGDMLDGVHTGQALSLLCL